MGDFESGSNSGSAGHIGDNWFASEEGSDVEAFGADNKVGFGAFFVKFGIVDTNIGAAVGAVANSIGVTLKF